MTPIEVFTEDDCDVTLPGGVRYLSVEKANRLLNERSTRVYAPSFRVNNEMKLAAAWSRIGPDDQDTHEALLIGQREIKRDE